MSHNIQANAVDVTIIYITEEINELTVNKYINEATNVCAEARTDDKNDRQKAALRCIEWVVCQRWE